MPKNLKIAPEHLENQLLLPEKASMDSKLGAELGAWFYIM